MRLRLASTAVLLFATVAAHADTVNFTLSNPTQSVTTTGGTLSFNASVFAPTSNTGSEDLNSLIFGVTPANAFTENADPFLNNYPYSLAPGESFSGLLFTLFVPGGTVANTYTGTVALFGGPTNTRLGLQTFTVNVTAPVAVTPEPSSFLLLGTGLAGMAAAFRRRFSVSSTR